MALPSRNSSSRRRREDAGKIVTGILFVLGVIASVFLMLSKSGQSVRIGVVVALWAVTLGVWAITRYRRRAPREDDAPPGHEPATLREYEAQLRSQGQLPEGQRTGAERTGESEELAALRVELAVLRHNLQRLFDSTAPSHASSADLFPMPELPSAETAASPRSDGWDAWQAPLPAAEADPTPAAAAAMTPVFEPDQPQVPAFASPYDDPVTAETMAVPPEFWLDPTPKPAPSTPSSEAPSSTAQSTTQEPIATPANGTPEVSQPVPAANPKPADWFGSKPESEQPTSARWQSVGATTADRAAQAQRCATPAQPNKSQPGQPAQSDKPQRAQVRRLAPKRARAAAANGQSASPKNAPATRESPQPDTKRIDRERATQRNGAERRPPAPRTAVGAHRHRPLDDTDDCATQKLSVAEIMANLKSEKGRSR